MTLGPAFTAIALLATAASNTSGTAGSSSGSEGTTAGTANRTSQAQRKGERVRPGTPMKPRVIEAPGAAVMVIPASFDPMQIGPFSSF